MSIYRVNDWEIFNPDESVKITVWEKLSKEIIILFGEGPHSKETQKKILDHSINYNIKELIKEIRTISNLKFWSFCLTLHGSLYEYVWRRSEIKEFVDVGIDEDTLAILRRFYKFILEEVSVQDINLTDEGSILDMNEANIILSRLYKIYRNIYNIYIFYSTLVDFNRRFNLKFENGLYDFSLDVFTQNIMFSYSMFSRESLGKSMYDTDTRKEYFRALKEVFSIDFNELVSLFQSKIGHTPNIFTKEDLQIHLTQLKGVNKDKISLFIEGLLIRPQQAELRIKKPFNLNRLLYKPLLKFNINGSEYIIFNWQSIYESFTHLGLHAFGHNKIPDQWQPTEMKRFADLTNKAQELRLLKYIASVAESKKLFAKINYNNINGAKRNINLNDFGKPGQIDILIIDIIRKTIYLSEVKYLQLRHDLISQGIEITKFETGYKGAKAFNKQLEDKYNFILENKADFLFQMKREFPNLDIDNVVIEPVFFINTPTAYMLNSIYKIYSVSQLEQLFSGINPYSKQTAETKSGLLIDIEHPYFDNYAEMIGDD